MYRFLMHKKQIAAIAEEMATFVLIDWYLMKTEQNKKHRKKKQKCVN